MVNKRVVQPDDDLLRLYLNDIGRHALLTKADEARLAQEIEAGRCAHAELSGAEALAPARQRELRRVVRRGDEATSTFVVANLRLVVSIAKRYQAPELPLLDLVQEGSLGLIHAVEKFDWRKGFKFSTYATWWIRQAITRGMANTGRAVRLPLHAGDLLNQLAKARTRLEGQLGRTATVAELAEDLQVSMDRISQLLYHTAAPLSLSTPFGLDGDTELGDLVEDRAAVSPSEAAAAAVLPREVVKMLACLGEREREVLRLRFGLDRGEPRTLDEVGLRFGLTRERIRQIEAKALSKLRHPTLGGEFRDLLTAEPSR